MIDPMNPVDKPLVRVEAISDGLFPEFSEAFGVLVAPGLKGGTVLTALSF